MGHDGFWHGNRSIYPTKGSKIEITTPGEYIIRTKTRWRHGNKDKFTLSAYAPTKIEMKKISPIKNFLNKLFVNIGSKSQLKNMNEGCAKTCNNYLHYVYFYFENKGSRKWIVDNTFTELENLRLGKNVKKVDEKSFHIEISPGERKVVILKKIDITQKIEMKKELKSNKV